MKSTLEFELPEEQEEFRNASEVGRILSGVSLVADELRTVLKYDELTDRERGLAERIRKILLDELGEYLP